MTFNQLNNENNLAQILVPKEQNTIFFITKDNTNKEILKVCENGDIFVNGKLAENDKEVVEALRQFLKSQGFLK